MKIIENQKFEFFEDYDSNELFENVSFSKCTFEYCQLSITENPHYRSLIRNVNLIDCKTKGGSIGSAIIEKSSIENLKTNGLVQIHGAVFNEVTLKGKFGKMMIINTINSADEDVVNAYLEANKQYYKNVSWALDISEADFIELNIRGISSDLIKRNPENQAVIRRENIPENWREIDFEDRLTEIVLGRIIYSNYDDYIYMTGKRDKNFDVIMKDIKTLRALGIADEN